MTHALAAIPRPRPGRAGRIPWRLILGVGAGYGLLTSAQQHLSSALSGRAYPWWMSFALQMPIAAAWAVATPGILWLGRRFPLPARRWPLNAAVHLAACLSFVFLLDLGSAWYWPHLMPLPPDAKPLLARAARLFVVWIFSDGLLYWTMLAVSSAADHYRRFRERELTASQLETQLARADLQGLKMQLHPHFLFNALHTIGSLVRTGDRDNAVKVTAGLGDLLRRMLDGAAQQEVPLKQELDFIRSYLDIEQIRFRDRLQVTFQVDPEVLDAKVPHLILQPLVENAIRHGIAPHLFAGRISVGARKVNGRLQLVVRDDGPGVGDGDAARPGIGLSNSRARLARLYGEDFALEVSNLPQGGLQARVELPFHLAPADWEGET